MAIITISLEDKYARILKIKKKKGKGAVKEYLQELIERDISNSEDEQLIKELKKGRELGGKFDRDEMYDNYLSQKLKSRKRK